MDWHAKAFAKKKETACRLNLKCFEMFDLSVNTCPSFASLIMFLEDCQMFCSHRYQIQTLFVSSLLLFKFSTCLSHSTSNFQQSLYLQLSVTQRGCIRYVQLSNRCHFSVLITQNVCMLRLKTVSSIIVLGTEILCGIIIFNKFIYVIKFATMLRCN